MTKWSIARSTACVVLVAVLTGCSGAPPTPPGNLRELPTPHDMVAQVRAAGVAPDALDVKPLRDPQVEDLRAHAAQLEAQSDYSGAAQALAQALKLVPDDPALLQLAAEEALYLKDWTQAETFAQMSFDRGPKLGSLCRRNWTTLRFVRLQRGDDAGAQAAIEKVAACTITAPARY
ncbi:MAG: hypothetical protein ABIT64_01860 [Lysobacteraceae bacterium]